MSLEGLQPLSVDLFFCAGIFLVFLVDLVFPRAGKALGVLTLTVMLATLLASFFLPTDGKALLATYEGGPWVLVFKRILLVAGGLSVLGGLDFVAERYPKRQGEYYLLLMVSLLGMMILPGARELILLLVAFELMSLPLYALASFGKVDSYDESENNSAEAGLKLFIVGAVSTVFTTLGIAMLYGMAGSTLVSALATMPTEPLALLGMVFVIGGMAYKIGTAPFHMWVPDTYEGAGTPFVGFLSVAPKLAGFAALITIFVGALGERTVLWVPIVMALSILTMVVGNLLALAQNNIKRLLAFSGVGQVGYMLMGLACADSLGLGMVVFYGAGYVVTNIGAFMVVQALAQNGGNDSVQSFDGLARRSPYLGLAMLLFLLSLAGIPFVVGFWAKLYVFMAAWQAGLFWLVLLGAALAVLGLFYYLQIARAMYMKPASDESTIKTGLPLGLGIALCLAAVVGMGLVPGPFVEVAKHAAAGF